MSMQPDETLTFELNQPELKLGFTLSFSLARRLEDGKVPEWYFQGHLNEINRYLKRGTCLGQVLALARCCLTESVLTLHVLEKALVEGIDDILRFHSLLALENSEIKSSEKISLPKPRVFPPNSNAERRVFAKKLEDYRQLDLYETIQHAFYTMDTQCVGIFCYYHIFSGHALFLMQQDDVYIGYNPDKATFYQGEMENVVGELIKRAPDQQAYQSYEVNTFERFLPKPKPDLNALRKMRRQRLSEKQETESLQSEHNLSGMLNQ